MAVSHVFQGQTFHRDGDPVVKPFEGIPLLFGLNYWVPTRTNPQQNNLPFVCFLFSFGPVFQTGWDPAVEP